MTATIPSAWTLDYIRQLRFYLAQPYCAIILQIFLYFTEMLTDGHHLVHLDYTTGTGGFRGGVLGKPLPTLSSLNDPLSIIATIFVRLVCLLINLTFYNFGIFMR